MRHQEERPKIRRKRVQVQPGKSVTSADIESDQEEVEESSSSDPALAFLGGGKKKLQKKRFFMLEEHFLVKKAHLLDTNLEHDLEELRIKNFTRDPKLSNFF